MIYYDEIVSYMRNLVSQNALLTPSTIRQAGVKNFLTMDMDEFLIGSQMALPTSEHGGFMIWINHQTRVEGDSELKDQKNFVFNVLKQFEKDNFAAEEAARALTERACHQINSRMAMDSRTNVFWKHALDKPKFTLDPLLLKKGSYYVGWMVTFSPTLPHQICFNNTDWHDLNS